MYHPAPSFRSAYDPYGRAGLPTGGADRTRVPPPGRLGAAAAAPDVLNVRTFGAVGDGRHDDTKAIQKAVSTVEGSIDPNTHGFAAVALYFPPGLYRVTEPIVIERRSARLTGCHGYGNWPTQGTRPGLGSALLYDGASDGSLLELRDTRDSYIADLMLLSAAGAHAAIHARSVEGADAGANRNLRIERCHIGSYPFEPSYASFTFPILFGGLNADNDRFSIRDVVLAAGAETEACLRIEQPQSIWGSCDCVSFEGGYGRRAVATGLSTAASVSLFNCAFNRCRTDLRLESSANVSVYGYQTERSARWVEFVPNDRGVSEGRLAVFGGVAQISDEMPQRDGGIYVVHASGLNGNAGLLWLGVKTYSRRGDTGRRAGWYVRAADESSGTSIVIRDDPYWRPTDFDLAVTPARRARAQRSAGAARLHFALDNGAFAERVGLAERETYRR